MQTVFFQSWPDLFRVALSAVAFYGVLIFLIRAGGKRSISKMNDFDWVVTVAVGNITASAILLDNVPVLNGLLAVLVLLVMKSAVTRGAVFSSGFRSAVYGKPTLLVYDGRFLEADLRRQNILREEVFTKLRAAGVRSLEEVAAVVLESDAELTVLRKNGSMPPPILKEVENLSEVLRAAH